MMRVSSPSATMSRAWRSVSRVHTKASGGAYHGWQFKGPYRSSDRSICGGCDRRKWSSLASACDFGAELLRGTATEATNTSKASSLDSNELSRIRQLWSTGSLTQAAHLAWEQVLQPGDTVVDATIGNGHDTLFLCRQVGSSGKVWGFDIQQEALEATRRRIDAELPHEQQPQLRLTCCCHSAMQEVVGSGQARLVSFNLGYLPGANKKVITTAVTTVAAVEAALEVVAAGSLISIMCYTGHEGGLEEYEAVVQLVRELPPAYWTVSQHLLVNRPSAPILMLVWRNGTPLPGRNRH